MCRGAAQVYKAYKDEVQEVAVKIFKPEEGGAQAVESNKFQMEIAIMKGARALGGHHVLVGSLCTTPSKALVAGMHACKAAAKGMHASVDLRAATGG